MLFSDWDRSGRRDLRISNDREYYVTARRRAAVALGEGAPPALYRERGWLAAGQTSGAWASPPHDVTGDGYPEIYLTSMFGNRLETLADGPGPPRYANIASERGVASGRPVAGDDKRPSTSWHPEFDDVNNDGLLDLYVSKGNLDAMPDRATDDPSSLLLGDPTATFVERAVGGRARQRRPGTRCGGRRPQPRRPARPRGGQSRRTGRSSNTC